MIVRFLFRLVVSQCHMYSSYGSNGYYLTSSLQVSNIELFHLLKWMECIISSCCIVPSFRRCRERTSHTLLFVYFYIRWSSHAGSRCCDFRPRSYLTRTSSCSTFGFSRLGLRSRRMLRLLHMPRYHERQLLLCAPLDVRNQFPPGHVPLKCKRQVVRARVIRRFGGRRNHCRGRRRGGSQFGLQALRCGRCGERQRGGIYAFQIQHLLPERLVVIHGVGYFLAFFASF